MPTRRLTPRGKERRRQLIDYATERFADNGYHPTSVADIVDGLGVGKGVFYWYFDSKEQLFLEILRVPARPPPAPAAGDRRRGRSGRRIELGIRAGVQWMAEHRELGACSSSRRPRRRSPRPARAGQRFASATRSPTSRRRSPRAGSATPTPRPWPTAILGVTNRLVHDLHRRAGRRPRDGRRPGRVVLPERPRRPGPDRDQPAPSISPAWSAPA